MSAERTTSTLVDPRRLERAALLLHFDASWWPRVLGGEVLGLNAAEKELLSRTDRRAFRADSERAARAAAVVTEELAVAVAVAGLPRLFGFFRDDAFLTVIEGQLPLVLAAARYLDNVPARIEGAVARARRRRRPPVAEVVVAAHVACAVAPDGAVHRWSAARASLGQDAVSAVGAGRRVSWGPDGEDDAGVLVQGDPGAPSVARCGKALAELLARFDVGGSAASFRAAARDLGCDDDAEADALLGELCADGLLVRR